MAVRALDAPRNEWLINADVGFHAASTMRVPVMVECHRQAHEGRFDLDDELRLKDSLRSIVDGTCYALSPAEDSYGALYHDLGFSSSGWGPKTGPGPCDGWGPRASGCDEASRI